MRSLAILTVAAAAALPLAAATPAFEAGEWEITVKTEMKGMPVAMPPQTTTFTSCLDPQQPVPVDPGSQGQCKVLDTKVEGNTVSWSISCEAEGSSMKGSGRITYRPDAFNGEQKVKISAGGGQEMEMQSQMSGKRLGPCAK